MHVAVGRKITAETARNGLGLSHVLERSRTVNKTVIWSYDTVIWSYKTVIWSYRPVCWTFSQEAKGGVELMHVAVGRKITTETARNGLSPSN